MNISHPLHPKLVGCFWHFFSWIFVFYFIFFINLIIDEWLLENQCWIICLFVYLFIVILQTTICLYMFCFFFWLISKLEFWFSTARYLDYVYLLSFIISMVSKLDSYVEVSQIFVYGRDMLYFKAIQWCNICFTVQTYYWLPSKFHESISDLEVIDKHYVRMFYWRCKKII